MLMDSSRLMKNAKEKEGGDGEECLAIRGGFPDKKMVFWSRSCGGRF